MIMKTTKLLFAAFLLWCIGALDLLAQQYRMPQDNWYYNGLRVDGAFGAITIGPDDNIYVATNRGAVMVLKTDGTFVSQFGSNMDIAGIAVSSETNIYVLDYNGSNYVKKFHPDGTLELSFGGHGSGETELNPSYPGDPPARSRLTVGAQDRIYVADGGNFRVQCYDKDGNHLRHWGEQSDGHGLPFHFFELESIAALPGNVICVRNSYSVPEPFPSGTWWHYELHTYTGDGQFLAIKTARSRGYHNARTRAIAATPDGLIWTMQGEQSFAFGGSEGHALFNVTTAESDDSAIAYHNADIKWMPFADSVFNPFWPVLAAFDRRGTMYITLGADSDFPERHLLGARRIYGTDASLQVSNPPLPYVLSAKQRPNTTLVDIDFRVDDGDDAEVSTALLAFINNGNDLETLRKPNTFVENTATNIGLHTIANAAHRVTWDASELATNFTSLQFEILAKDNRGLLPLNLITIPTNGNQHPLTMNRSAISDDDLLSVWYWLIGTNHPAITLTTGIVRRISDGQTLASGTSTSSEGRQFLYSVLGLRSPTGPEIDRAKGGNYGFIGTPAENHVIKP